MSLVVTRKRLLSFSRRAVRWLFLPALALIVWGELSPNPLPDAFEATSDKLLHFTAYFILGGMAWSVFREGRRGALAVFVVIVLGGVLEVLQGMVGRDMSFWDEVANTAGALTGVGAAVLYRRLLEIGSGRN